MLEFPFLPEYDEVTEFPLSGQGRSFCRAST